MRQSYATSFVCDACGAIDNAPPPDVPSAYGSPVPAGWLGHGEKPGMVWCLTNPFGSQFRDICPSCMTLPLGELVQKIMQQSEKRANG